MTAKVEDLAGLLKSDECAFPVKNKIGEVEVSAGGLTKRELFAAMALMGICAKPILMVGDDDGAKITRAKMSIDAVEHADFLIAALEKKDEST